MTMSEAEMNAGAEIKDIKQAPLEHGYTWDAGDLPLTCDSYQALAQPFPQRVYGRHFARAGGRGRRGL